LARFEFGFGQFPGQHNTSDIGQLTAAPYAFMENNAKSFLYPLLKKKVKGYIEFVKMREEIISNSIKYIYS